jgi:hypothetical protein
MLLFWIMCLQISCSWARFSTSNMSFILNGDMLSKCIHYFNCCSTTHNMLLVIINISSMIMTCAFLKRSMTFISLGRMEKYLHIGIRNALCIIVIWSSNEMLQHLWLLIVVHFYQTIENVVWCIFIKKYILSLPTTTMTIRKPCEF